MGGYCRLRKPPYGIFAYSTGKESVLKANGKGLNIDLKSFFISDREAILEDVVLYLHEVHFSTGYKCCLAIDRVITKDEIYKEEINFLSLY